MMLRQFLNPPNWFTAASMFCGLYSIVLATGVGGEQNFYRAGLMILFAGVFDTIDGSVARLTKTGSEFGIQLDSLVDVVSFGIAPAMLLYAWGTHSLGVLGLAGAFFFALCGVFRLARFNCKADGTKHAFTEGLTITMGGAMVAAAVMAHARALPDTELNPFGVLAIAFCLALLMVSSVPYRGWKTLRLRRRDILGIALVLGFTLLMAVRFDISLAFFSALAVYSASGPVEALLTRRWSVGDEHLQPAAVRGGGPLPSGALSGAQDQDHDELDEEDEGP
jgi:CDP-diacylglycerol--serine O-phosphatidyltransferase